MRRREWIAAALIGFAMTLSSNFTRADEVVDPGSLNIVDPIISKGSNGSYRLMFILENHTGMPITILGISSSYFSDATFEFRSDGEAGRSEEQTSELQSLMRPSYAVFCLKTKPAYTFIPTIKTRKEQHT